MDEILENPIKDVDDANLAVEQEREQAIENDKLDEQAQEVSSEEVQTQEEIDGVVGVGDEKLKEENDEELPADSHVEDHGQEGMDKTAEELLNLQN